MAHLPGSPDAPLVTNATSTTQQRAAKKKLSHQEWQQRENWRRVLALQEGRDLIWWLLGECRVFESVFEPNSRMAYLAGKQDVGHTIFGEMMRADPNAYIQMQLEHKEEDDDG